MTLTWLGHSCFILQQDGYRIVVDPYAGVEGYPELHVSAHAVACSHEHFDHHAIHTVTRLPAAESPFSIREISSFHDDQGGGLRGKNVIHVFTAGSISVAHLGDLGHLPTPAQKEQIGMVHVLLVPVGGIYTIDAVRAKEVCTILHPKCVIPMHYRHAPYGLSNLAGVEDFLKLWDPMSIQRLSGPEIEVDSNISGVVLPVFCKKTT